MSMGLAVPGEGKASKGLVVLCYRRRKGLKGLVVLCYRRKERLVWGWLLQEERKVSMGLVVTGGGKACMGWLLQEERKACMGWLCFVTGGKKAPNTEITKQPRSWYSVLCNRWVSLVGVSVAWVTVS